MELYKKYCALSLFLIILISNHNFFPTSDLLSNHVIFSLRKEPSKKITKNKLNELIHTSTYEIKQECKRFAPYIKNSNSTYKHRSDSVFFVHLDDQYDNWTLYKPSYIPYDQFRKISKKIYKKHGLKVTCQKDEEVTITFSNLREGKAYLSLQDLELAKKMSDEDFDNEVEILKSNNSPQDKINKLLDEQDMKKMFYWHLQIPTTGLMKGGSFDIPNIGKPLAWNFLLWDLAPKKGSGANVAIIDTGVSAFDIDESEFDHEYKKNINLSMINRLQNYGYNLISENGLDPIRQIAINFGHYCDHEKFDSNELMENLPIWIIKFIKNEDSSQIEKYFIANAQKHMLSEDLSSLNEKGEESLKDLLIGKYGIKPFGDNSFFHIVNLQDPYNQEILLETLPAPKISSNSNSFAAGHGTFTQGLVNAKINDNLGINGFAPEAHVVMIKAFHDNGVTNKTTLNAALQRALALQTPIVSMSLKITDSIDKVKDKTLKDLVDSIDYVVAASGNDGNTDKLRNKEAYPAKFGSVAFDVGAFEYDSERYSVCDFTQKEPLIGPKFLAPGADIFSTGLTPNQTEDSMYEFMSGTSIAVPIVTGFLALAVAEFQDDFTREEILKVIYKNSIKLNNDDSWQKNIILGTIDMRSALLCLHVLRSLKKELSDNNKYSYKNNFNNLVQAIYTMNYYIPTKYETQLGFNLTKSFSEYSNALKEQAESLPDIKYFKTPENATPQENLKSCINFMTEFIVLAINNIPSPKSMSKKIQKNSKKNDDLKKQIQKILITKNLNLFIQLSPSYKNRIKLALAPRRKIKV